MKRQKRSIVDIQELDEVAGCAGSYEKHVESFSESNGNQQREDARANPDILPENAPMTPSSPQLIMGEAIEHLQGRQKEVYTLTMREGKSIAEAGRVLRISKATAQDYRDRAIQFITQYCQQAIDGGRV